MAQQGPPPPPRRGRASTTSRRGDSRAVGRNSWDDLDTTDTERPPWAGPAVGPRWSDQEARQRRRHAREETGPTLEARVPQTPTPQTPAPSARGTDTWDDPDDGDGWDSTPLRAPEPRGPGFRSRRAAERSRRRSRTYWVWGGAIAVVAVIAVVYLAFFGGSPAPKSNTDGLVTTFQKGELRTVPNTCTAVTSATLGQYLPGRLNVVVPHSLDGSAQSLCNWTLSAARVYRVLEVSAQAYSPNALATGDGSATFAAEDAYAQALQAMRHPAKDTHLPPGTVTTMPGLGTTAFAALQVVLARGASTDLESVVVRDHNVVVTVVFQGPHSRSGRVGPVSPTLLQAGAIAAARDIVSKLH